MTTETGTVTGMLPSAAEPGQQFGLRPYLHGHHLGACVGVALFERAAREQATRTVRDELSSLAREIDEDRSSLEQIMERCGLRVTPLRRGITGVVVRVRTVVPRRLGRRSGELADLLELEALGDAVHAKLLGWTALRSCVDDTPLDGGELDRLIHRAEDQESRLERMRRDAAPSALGKDA